MENKPKFEIPPYREPSLLSRFRERIKSLLRHGPYYIAAGCGAAVFFWLGAGLYVKIHGVGLETVGGQGQACYPNDTCDRGLTCFEIRDDRVCEREVRPVVSAGSKSCFEYSTKEGELHVPCFDSNDECLRSFGRVMQTEATILKGCGFE